MGLEEIKNYRLQQEIDRFNKYNKLEGLLALTLDLVNKVEEAFSNQGHSGFSASYCFSHLKALIEDAEGTKAKLRNALEQSEGYSMQRLITDNIMEIYDLIKYKNKLIQKAIINILEGKPTTPLTGEADEWVESTFYGDEDRYTVYTNRRCSRVSKYVMPDGIEICTYLDDVCYSDNGGYTHFTTGRFGRRQITFPFTPPETSEVVYIYEVEGRTPFILTDPKTIEQVKDNYVKMRDSQ